VHRLGAAPAKEHPQRLKEQLHEQAGQRRQVQEHEQGQQQQPP
tara:strand:+ start:723 stop:851 length:129 start_codon:yes stop_codon:yes gene_type:complete